MVDRRSGGGPEDWSEDDWQGGDWERPERPRPTAPRGTERVRPRAPQADREDVDADLSRVMDDPMFDALPGGVPLRDRGRPGMRGPDRLSARRERSGLSAGQWVLLFFAIALVAGVSFAAGLLMGASGDRTQLAWIPGFGTRAAETITADKPADAYVASDAPAEGVITFSEHGRVPPKTEEGSEPSAEEKARAEAASRPRKGEDTGAGPEKKAEAAAPEAPIEAKAGRGDAPAGTPEPARKAAGAKPSEEMTFYDTATGKREVPGLDAEGTAEADSEAVAEPAPSEQGVPGEARTGEQAVAGADGPLGADVLARRRAEQAEPPPPPDPAAGAGAQEATPEGPPSGAELLARRRAESVPGNAELPAATEAAPAAGSYTVQVATLTSSEEARGLAERLAAKGFRARVDTLAGAGGSTLYRVRVGRYGDERSAQRDLDRIREEPGTSPFIKME